MATTIQEYVDERQIKGLFHFTKATNLQSILSRGLLTRDILREEGQGAVFNDAYRLDKTDAVCLSIGFPNYKMFWSLREQNKANGVDWIVLAIKPSVLWELPAAFCQENAAATSVTSVPLRSRMSLDSMKSMYDDYKDKSRSSLSLVNSYPTNPQAEVLMLSGVPSKYIAGALVLNTSIKERLTIAHPGFEFKVHAGYFRYRNDYAHWKKEV